MAESSASPSANPPVSPEAGVSQTAKIVLALAAAAATYFGGVSGQLAPWTTRESGDTIKAKLDATDKTLGERITQAGLTMSAIGAKCDTENAQQNERITRLEEQITYLRERIGKVDGYLFEPNSGRPRR